MSLSILLYPSNLINYVRVLLTFLMFYNIKNYPFFGFIISIIGGFIDLIDGPIARYSLLTSKFGYFLDVSMDRITGIILIVFLARLYPRYWHVFCMLVLIEFTRDLTSSIVSSQWSILNYVDIVKSQSSSKEDMLTQLKYEILSKAGLNTNDLKLPPPVTSDILVASEEQNNAITVFLKDFRNFILPYSWYMSDLFFWFMYCGGILVGQQQQCDINNNNSNSNVLPYVNEKDSARDQILILGSDYRVSFHALATTPRNDFESSALKRLFAFVINELKYSIKLRMHPLFYYVPNVFAYLRVIFITIAIYKFPKNPIVSFIFTLSSGLLDGIDGNFARALHQTSKLGMLFDLSMDRLTNIAQAFFLTRMFPKYCTIFLLVGFMEIIRDVVYWIYAYYSVLLVVFTQLYVQKDNLAEYKQNIYDHMIANKKPASQAIIRPYGEFVHELVYPLIWYTSDLFYWTIYCAGFYMKRTRDNKLASPSSSCSSRSSTISSSNESPKEFILLNEDDTLINYDERVLTPLSITEIETKLPLIDYFDSTETRQYVPVKRNKKGFIQKVTRAVNHFISLFEYVGKSLDEFIEAKFFQFKFIKFQSVFSLIGICFLIGAVLKFCLSSYEFLLLTYNLILIDITSVDYSVVFKLKDSLVEKKNS